jgi:hypothetical protein
VLEPKAIARSRDLAEALSQAELVAAPVRFMDGKTSTWWTPPAETRHL